MNNSQTLKALKESIESRAKENENIINETTKRYLQNLTSSLMSEYKQKLDSMQNEIKESQEKILNEAILRTSQAQNRILENLREYSTEPIKLRLKTLAMSCLVGMLVMMILCLIAWYQWIRPYQVSRNLTQESNTGKIYIDTSKTEIQKHNDTIYILIK